MQAVADSLNFQLDIHPPPNGELWGEFNATTATYSGMVGELQKGVSEVGWLNLFIVPQQMEYIDYTAPYLIDYGGFMMLRPPALPQWQALTYPLHWQVWLATLASSLVMAAIYRCLLVLLLLQLLLSRLYSSKMSWWTGDPHFHTIDCELDVILS